MHFNPYGGSAAQVAAALVNAQDQPAPVMRDVMRAQGMWVAELTAEQARDVIDWARRLRPVFGGDDVGARIDLVNGLLEESACAPYIARHDGLPPHLHYASEHADTVVRVRAYTAGGLAHALCEDPDRVGTCARTGCDVVFVDTSRNGRRRFCTTRCATRVHVAEHRGRQRS